VSVNSEGTVVFNSSQKLAALTVTGDSVATMQARPNGSSSIARVLRLGSLNLGPDGTPTGTLDLKDNVMLIDYSGSSPEGTWNGSAYTGITGWIQIGYDGGLWDGQGIVTSITTAISPNVLTLIGICEASEALGFTGDTAVWGTET